MASKRAISEISVGEVYGKMVERKSCVRTGVQLGRAKVCDSFASNELIGLATLRCVLQHDPGVKCTQSVMLP